MATILVVDDEADSRIILARILESEGYTVVTATNGQEALDQAAATRPALILMDLNMPVLTGWEATARLKAHPILAPIPIIAVTAHGLGYELDRAFQAGCSDFLSKPVDMPVLIQTIQDHLAALT